MARIREAARVVRDAGGRVVGKTRLQKIAFLLEVAGLGEGFAFQYRRFGPFSEELATAAQDAGLLGLMDEHENRASWGGTYSVFLTELPQEAEVPPQRKQLARTAAGADSIELELAATALFLSLQGERAPWLETARRKPEKAEGGRLERARMLYNTLRQIETPKPLPILD
jgi:uncharacterized protein YwgA